LVRGLRAPPACGSESYKKLTGWRSALRCCRTRGAACTGQASTAAKPSCYNARVNKIEIRTRDGICPSYVYRPAAGRPWPAVLIFMDGIGIRPAMLEIGERLASHGYYVLLPDLFYRSGAYEPMDARVVFTDPAKRKILMEKFFALATPANVMSDTGAFLDYLAAQPEVKPGGIGTTGYCLGGLMSLSAAGTYPDRILATASYHGARLASDAPDSPHLLAPKIKSRVYIAGAIEDQSFPEEMKLRLADALSQAGVDYQIETYPARHGWVLRDTPVYDAAASERHWQTMLALFDATLRH
jgi:carboxymethylenebutenolidase